MNKEILIFENKVLKLKNVFSKSIIINDNSKPLNIIVKEFDDYMKNNKLEGYGPLIIKTGIVGTTEKKMMIKLMRQLKNDNISVVFPYEFLAELKTPPCLLSRFQGVEKDSSMAGLKMQVYAYENSLILDVESYVISKKEKDELIIDTFIPIIGKF